MIVNKIYLGMGMIHRIYHRGEMVYQRDPIAFQVIEDGKLIILGALKANSLPGGLYLDCAPDVDWIYPVKSGNVLTIEQVYKATQSGNVLEVE